MKPWIFMLMMVAVALPLAAQSNAPVRLALVSESAGAAPVADVLTAQLSGNPGIQLLERDQIAKVWHEQGLSAENTDYVKLGQVLGADGLLILHLSRASDPPTLSLRLVAVKPGVTLDEHEYPWPLENAVQWSDLAGREFEPLFPKLMVLPQDAVKISILNLRSAVASAKSQALEEDATLMLSQRLTAAPQVFVLERRRMELLSAEKEFNGADESPFWNGSLLLDGVIDKDGYNPDRVTMSIKLTPPNGKNVVTVEAAGARTNLPAVVDDLTRQILAGIKSGGQVAPWDAAAEADRYFNEAQWMAKWKMLEEARAAGEAAWALGKQTPEVGQFRIKAWLAAAGDPGLCGIQNETKKVGFGHRFSERRTDYSDITAFATVPAPEKFAEAVQAAELYAELFQLYQVPDPKPDPAWFALGGQVLDNTSWWLRYYYFTVEARPGQADRIQSAQELCREIMSAMQQHPGFANADTSHTLLQLKARHAAFWVETPEQGVAEYREMVAAGEWPLVRRRFYNTSWHETATPGSFTTASATGPGADLGSPCLAGWQWADRQRWPKVWEDFIDELSRSPKPLVRLEGGILRCSYSWSEAGFEQNLGQLLDQVRQNQNALAATGQGEAWLDDLKAMVEPRLGLLTAERGQRIRDTLWTDFARQFDQYVREHQPEPGTDVEPAERLAQFEARKSFLNAGNHFDPLPFFKILPSNEDEYNRLEAKSLLPLLNSYAARIAAAPPDGTNDLAVIVSRNSKDTAKFFIGNLEEVLTKLAAPPQPPVAQVSAPPMDISRPSRITPWNAPPQPETSAQPSVPGNTVLDHLEVSRFWQVPTPDNLQLVTNIDGSIAYQYFGGPFVPHIDSACYRDGRLWVEVRYDPADFKGKADFFGIDLDTFATEKVLFASQSPAGEGGGSSPGFSLPEFSFRGRTHSFEVYKGYLYVPVSANDSPVQRYSLKDHAWEPFSVPAEGDVSVLRLGDRLFFTSETSIMEYQPDGSFEVLASNRRQPAQNTLDRVDDYQTGPRLFLTADHTLHACIGSAIYAYLPDVHDWRQIVTLPALNPANYYPLADGFIAMCGQFLPPNTVPNASALNRGWWGMFGSLTAPELMFGDSVPGSQAAFLSAHGVSIPAQQPHWAGNIPSAYLCQQENCLWFLAGAPEVRIDDSGQLQISDVSGRETHLVRRQEGEAAAVTIPLRFKTENITLTPRLIEGARKLIRGRDMPWIARWILTAAPQGLVAINSKTPGVWLVPQTSLTPLLAAYDTKDENKNPQPWHIPQAVPSATFNENRTANQPRPPFGRPMGFQFGMPPAFMRHVPRRPDNATNQSDPPLPPVIMAPANP